MSPTEPNAAVVDGFAVRRADVKDLPTLVDFAVWEAQEAEGITKARECVLAGVKRGLEDNEIARYWVGEDAQGNMLGNISVVREWSNWNAGFYWWIQSMFIVPEQRGRGLMHLLVEKVIEAARSENALDIRLCVHRDNARAAKAYRKIGFRDASYRVMSMEL